MNTAEEIREESARLNPERFTLREVIQCALIGFALFIGAFVLLALAMCL